MEEETAPRDLIGEFYDKTRVLCYSRLSSHEPGEIYHYLRLIDWPKFPSRELLRPNVHTHLPLWLLDKWIPQLRHASVGKDEAKSDNLEYNPLGFPSLYRPCDVSLLNYFIYHIYSVNYLSGHSYTLWKVVALKHLFRDDILNKSNVRDKAIYIVGVIKSNTEKAADALSSYRSLVHEMTRLFATLVEDMPRAFKSTRDGNRFVQSPAVGDVIRVLVDLVDAFKVWTLVFVAMESQVSLLNELVQLLSHLLEYSSLISNVIMTHMNDKSLLKSAFNSVLMHFENVLQFRVYLEDMWTALRVVINKTPNAISKDVATSALGHVQLAIECICNLLSFAEGSSFATGFCDFCTSTIYNNALQGSIDGIVLDENRASYATRYLGVILRLLCKSTYNDDELISARGLMLVYPSILQQLVDTLEQHASSANAVHTAAYYCNRYFTLLYPKIMHVFTTCEGGQTSLSSTNFTLFDSIHSFYSVLSIARDNQLLLYTGDESDSLRAMLDDCLAFILKTLKLIAIRYRKTVIVQTLKNTNGELDVLHARECLYRITVGNGSAISSLYLAALLWSSLDILISLNLEYANSNLSAILTLLKDEYSYYATEEVDLQSFSTLVCGTMDSHALNNPLLPSQEFVGHLIEMYAEANDLASLVEKVAEFLISSNEDGNMLFFNHPHAIAFQPLPLQSSMFQVPKILQTLAQYSGTEKCSKFMYNIFLWYVTGVDFAPAIIKQSISSLYTILSSMPLEPTCQGISLGMYSVIIIRKLLTFDCSEGVVHSLNHILEVSYSFLCSLKDHASNNANSPTIIALCWYCYHFAMLRLEQPFIPCLHWCSGIEAMLQHLASLCAGSKNLELSLMFMNIVIGNPTAFSELACYNPCGLVVLQRVLGSKLSQSSLQGIKKLVENVRLNETLEKETLDKLIGHFSACNLVGIAEQVALEIMAILLDTSSSLYDSTSTGNIVGILESIALFGNKVVSESNAKRRESAMLTRDVLGCIFRILTNDCVTGNMKCQGRILIDYKNFGKEQDDAQLSYGLVEHRVDLIAFLQNVKNFANYKDTPCKEISTELGQVLALIHSVAMKFDEIDVVALANGDNAAKNTSILFGRLLAHVCDYQDLDSLIVVERHTLGKQYSTVIVLLTVLKVLYPSEGATPDFLIHGAQEFTQMFNNMMDNLSQRCNKESTAIYYFTYLDILSYWIGVHYNLDDLLGHLHLLVRACKSCSRPSFLKSHMVVCQSILHFLAEVLAKIDVERLASKPIWDKVMHLIFMVTNIDVLHSVNNTGEEEIVCKVEDAQDILPAGFKVIHTLFNKCPNINDFVHFHGHLEILFDEYDIDENQWISKVACIQVLLVLIATMESAGSSFRREPMEFIKSGLFLKIKVMLATHARDIENALDTHFNQGSNMEVAILFNYSKNANISIKLYNMIRRYDEAKHDTHGNIPLEFGNHLMTLATVGLKIWQLCRDAEKSSILCQALVKLLCTCVYTRIKIAEGEADAQVVRNSRPWTDSMFQVIVFLHKFIDMIQHHDHETYEQLQQLVVIILDKRIVESTKIYAVGFMPSLVKAWYQVDLKLKTGEKREQVLESDRILKETVDHVMRNCKEDVAKSIHMQLQPHLCSFYNKRRLAMSN